MPDDLRPSLIAKLAQAGGGESALLHFLLENIPDRIYFKDTDSKFLRISREMARFFKLGSAYEAIGKSDFDFFTKEHAQAAFADEQEMMRTGEPIIGKVEKETLPNGDVGWCLTTKMPLRNAHGKIIGTCGISKDFTAQKSLEDAVATINNELLERQQKLEAALTELGAAHGNLKAMQQELLEAGKMQAIGRLAYGVAHEIRNPLNVCQAGLDFFAGVPAIQGDPAQAEILREMQTAIRQADAVISTLMETTSPGHCRLEPSDLHGVIEASLAAREADCRRHRITVHREFTTELRTLRVDPVKLQQVFDGVFANAIDAMAGGGELTVRTLARPLTPDEIARDPGLRHARRFRAGETVAVIEIDDTGPGIAAETLPRIFEPFFTTKETGSGTGLGLTVCRTIVELHDGTMQIRNRDGGGVRVSLLLKGSA